MKPTQANIDKALKALRVNVPYYTVTQQRDVITFTTRNGAVTWRVTLPQETNMVTEKSGAHGKPVAKKKPALRARCQAMTKAGRQCKGKATKGSNPPRCAVHSP